LFEPNPKYWSEIQEIASQYNGEAFQRAVGVSDHETLVFHNFVGNEDATSAFKADTQVLSQLAEVTEFTTQTIDIAQFLKAHVLPEDDVVVRMDIQGSEYKVLRHLLVSGAACLMDKIFIEYHALHGSSTSKYLPLDGTLSWVLSGCPHLDIGTVNFYACHCDIVKTSGGIPQLRGTGTTHRTYRADRELLKFLICQVIIKSGTDPNL